MFVSPEKVTVVLTPVPEMLFKVFVRAPLGNQLKSLVVAGVEVQLIVPAVAGFAQLTGACNCESALFPKEATNTRKIPSNL